MSAELIIEGDELADELWEKYEQRKAQLPVGLSPQEYSAEVMRIADELGI